MRAAPTRLPSGLFSILLPACSADVLRFVLCTEVPYVWLLDCRVPSVEGSVQSELKNLFPRAQHEVTVQCSAWCHFGLSTVDFLAELDDADVRLRFDNGVDLIQAFRPLPRKFRPDAVASRSQVWVHRSLSIYLQFVSPIATRLRWLRQQIERYFRG